MRVGEQETAAPTVESWIELAGKQTNLIGKFAKDNSELECKNAELRDEVADLLREREQLREDVKELENDLKIAASKEVAEAGNNIAVRELQAQVDQLKKDKKELRAKVELAKTEVESELATWRHKAGLNGFQVRKGRLNAIEWFINLVNPKN